MEAAGRRTRHSVIAEVTLCFILLTGASFTIRGLLQPQDPSQPRRLLTRHPIWQAAGLSKTLDSQWRPQHIAAQIFQLLSPMRRLADIGMNTESIDIGATSHGWFRLGIADSCSNKAA